MKLSPDIAARIASHLPEGYSAEGIRVFTARGEIVEGQALDSIEQLDVSDADRAQIATAFDDEVKRAGGPPVLSNGLPTVMRIVAWLAHEGRNDNGAAFLADDLGPAADRIREPNFIVMDWNHSAVYPWSYDPKAIGLWYKAEKRWDAKANGGKGAYGILAYGVMWAWAFPEQANSMLADQERNGSINFSMAALPKSVTYADKADQYGGLPTEILHEPVFLTLAALDVRPADIDANGAGVEGSNEPDAETQLRDRLDQRTPARAASVAANDDPAPPNDIIAADAAAVAAAGAAEREQMEPEQAAQDAVMEALMNEEELQALRDAHAQALAAAETARAEADARAVAAEAARAELEGQLADATTARDALVTEAATVAEQVTSLTSELEAAQARLAEIDAAVETAAQETRFTARLAALPKSYVATLKTKGREVAFKERWLAAADEAWTEFLADLMPAFDEVHTSANAITNYLALSQREGGALPTAADENGEIAGLLGEIRK